MFLISCLLLLGMESVAHGVDPGGGDVVLAVGEQYRVSAEAGTRFSVGDRSVIQVRTLQPGTQGPVVLVKGKAKGFSDLILFQGTQTKTLRFQIIASRPLVGAVVDRKKNLQATLENTPGIDLLSSGDHWVVRGEAKSAEDLNLVDALANPNRAPMEKLLSLNPVARKAAEERIRLLLADAGLASVTVRGAGSRIWLEGHTFSKFEETLALNLGREVFRGVESRISQPFERQPIIRFKVRILELTKLQGENLGLAWSNSIPGIVTLHQKLLKGNVSLDATLNMLARSGRARLLSEPVIVLNAQGVAELKVGGEFPVPVKNRGHNSVTWKPYGLLLHIEVPGAAANLVRAKVGVSVSSIDMANSVEGIPAVRLNQMDTTVDLTQGKTVFLSGLIDASQSEVEAGLPFLSKVPILGALFRSRDFLERRSELVMAITAQNSEAGALP